MSLDNELREAADLVAVNKKHAKQLAIAAAIAFGAGLFLGILF